MNEMQDRTWMVMHINLIDTSMTPIKALISCWYLQSIWLSSFEHHPIYGRSKLDERMGKVSVTSVQSSMLVVWRHLGVHDSTHQVATHIQVDCGAIQQSEIKVIKSRPNCKFRPNES